MTRSPTPRPRPRPHRPCRRRAARSSPARPRNRLPSPPRRRRPCARPSTSTSSRSRRASSPTSSRTPGAPRPACRWPSPSWDWRHDGRLPARAPGPGPRVGELRATATTATGAPRRWRLALEALRRGGLRGPRLRDPQRRPARRRGGDRDDRLAGHPARLARRPHLGHDRLQGRRRPVGVRRREGLEGAYILDPWYPPVSSIWGRSDPPGTFQDAAEMERNYLRWKRPEGRYPERDGLYISVVPTISVSRSAEPPAPSQPADEEDRRAAGPWPPCRPHNRAGWRGCRPARRGAGDTATTTPSPTNEAMTWRSVSCVAYRPRDSG